MVAPARIPIPDRQIEEFCRRFGVKEFALFGSVLTDAFSPQSDVDVLLTFHDGKGITFDNRPDILDAVQALFPGRQVDVVEKPLIRNPFRRRHILDHHRVIYAA